LKNKPFNHIKIVTFRINTPINQLELEEIGI